LFSKTRAWVEHFLSGNPLNDDNLWAIHYNLEVNHDLRRYGLPETPGTVNYLFNRTLESVGIAVAPYFPPTRGLLVTSLVLTPRYMFSGEYDWGHGEIVSQITSSGIWGGSAWDRANRVVKQHIEAVKRWNAPCAFPDTNLRQYNGRPRSSYPAAALQRYVDGGKESLEDIISKACSQECEEIKILLSDPDMTEEAREALYARWGTVRKRVEDRIRKRLARMKKMSGH